MYFSNNLNYGKIINPIRRRRRAGSAPPVRRRLPARRPRIRRRLPVPVRPGNGPHLLRFRPEMALSTALLPAGDVLLLLIRDHPPKDGADAVAARSRGAAAETDTVNTVQQPAEPCLVCAVLTGDRGGLDREVTEAFRASGASHILALSGLHMGFIYMLVRSATAFLGYTPAARIVRCVLGIAFAVMFTLATGASPSTQRACIFIILRELAAVSQVRRSPPAHSLCTALLLQLAFRPDFISNAGFQLSYLAMAGIVFIHPVLKGWYPAPDNLRKGRLDPARRIWETASLSISCQVFTAPAAYLHFGIFPKYFLLTNLISLPLTSVIMALSAGVTLLWGLGICPAFLINMNEKAIELLISSLQIISGM